MPCLGSQILLWEVRCGRLAPELALLTSTPHGSPELLPALRWACGLSVVKPARCSVFSLLTSLSHFLFPSFSSEILSCCCPPSRPDPDCLPRPATELSPQAFPSAHGSWGVTPFFIDSMSSSSFIYFLPRLWEIQF